MPNKTFTFLCFIMFLSMTGYGVILPALPYLAVELHLSSFQMGSLITAWALAQTFSVPIWGRLADRIGRRPIVLFGLAGFSIAFFLLFFASSYTELLLYRIVGAILSSGLQPAAMALVVDSFDKKSRSEAIAKLGAANGLGFLCGPALGSLFSPFGIEIPFIVSGCLSLLCIPFTFHFLQEPPQKNILQTKQVSFYASFVFLKHPQYRQLFFVTFGMALAASTMFSMLGYFLIDKFDASSTHTGTAFSIQSAAAVCIQLFFMSFLFKKYQEKSITFSGLLLQASGFLCLVLSYSILTVYLGCLLVGLGGALSRPAILSQLSKQKTMGQGTVMGLQQSMDSFGRTIGPLIAGLLFTIHISIPFIFATIICFILILSFFYSSSNNQKQNWEEKVLSK